MRDAIHALLEGTITMFRAPHLVLVALVVTMLATAPFALWLGYRLQQAMPVEALTRTTNEIDPEWWLEFRRHATGLEATFAPAVVGFSAPLSTLSAVLDGTPPEPALLVPVVVAATAWAFLWGGLLQRLAHGRLGVAGFWSAAWRWWGPFVAIALLAAVATIVLYATVHRVLFGPVFGAVVAAGVSEPIALATRAGLYLIFGTLLAGVMLVADYARAFGAVTGERRVRVLIAKGWGMLRDSTGSVAWLYLFTGLLLALLLAGYGLGEAYGGSRVGGWRAVAIGQAFIVGRLGIRLAGAAAEVALLQRYLGRANVSPRS